MQTAARVLSFFFICLSVALSTLPLQAAGRLTNHHNLDQNSTLSLALRATGWNCSRTAGTLPLAALCTTVIRCMCVPSLQRSPWCALTVVTTTPQTPAPPVRRSGLGRGLTHDDDDIVCCFCRLDVQCMSKESFYKTFHKTNPFKNPLSFYADSDEVRGHSLTCRDIHITQCVSPHVGWQDHQDCTKEGLEYAITLFKAYNDIDKKINGPNGLKEELRHTGMPLYNPKKINDNIAELEKKLNKVREELEPKVKTK